MRVKMSETWKCSDCKQVKDKSEYRLSDKYSKGFTSRCKPCETIKNRELRLKRNERINSCLEEYLTVKIRNMKKYDRKARIEVLTELTVEDLKKLIDSQENKCCYTGVKLEWRLDADVYHKGSFDRLDVKFGHEIDNLCVSSVHANLLRNTTPRDEFIRKLNNASFDHCELDDIVC